MNTFAIAAAPDEIGSVAKIRGQHRKTLAEFIADLPIDLTEDFGDVFGAQARVGSTRYKLRGLDYDAVYLSRERVITTIAHRYPQRPILGLEPLVG